MILHAQAVVQLRGTALSAFLPARKSVSAGKKSTKTGETGKKMKPRKQRNEEAAVRQEEYDALSTEQKIARAKSRRGESKKELRRLECQTK